MTRTRVSGKRFDPEGGLLSPLLSNFVLHELKSKLD